MLTYNNKILLGGTKWLGAVASGLPPYTASLLYKDGVIPTFTKGTAKQVSRSPNIWLLTYENANWYRLLWEHTDLLKILAINSTGVTDMSHMCLSCHSLTDVALFDTSAVTNMEHMFGACYNLKAVPLFDTSNVTNMYGTFDNCRTLTSIPLLDTSSVTDMMYTFGGCYNLVDVPLLDTSSVTEMHSTFMYCTSLKTLPLLDTHNVKRTFHMFYGCTNLKTIPLFNTSKLEDAMAMFFECTNVDSGALALYNQMSTQTTPPYLHNGTFYNCGINSTTGSAELAQIPSDWKSRT